MERQLEFFKEKIIQTLSEVKDDIGETRFDLYVQMVLKCNDYDELKEMAELEMQLESILYTQQSIRKKLDQQSVELKDLRKVCYPTDVIPEDQPLETGELEDDLDDPDSIELLALQLQKRLEEIPPEELYRPQNFDADDFLTEDERMENLAIQMAQELGDDDELDEADEEASGSEDEEGDRYDLEGLDEYFEDEDNSEDGSDERDESEEADTFNLEGLDEYFDDEDEGSGGSEGSYDSDQKDYDGDSDNFDTAGLDEYFYDDPDSPKNDDSSEGDDDSSADTYDTTGLDEYFEDEPSDLGEEDGEEDSYDTTGLDEYFEDESDADSDDSDTDSDEPDTYDTEGLDEYFEDESEEDESDADSDDSDTYDTEGLDEYFEDEAEGDESEAEGDDSDTYDTEGLDEYFEDDEGDEQSNSSSHSSLSSHTSPNPSNSSASPDGRKLTFVRGPHAKSTQKTFDSMSKVQGMLGKFGKRIINNVASDSPIDKTNKNKIGQ